MTGKSLWVAVERSSVGIGSGVDGGEGVGWTGGVVVCAGLLGKKLANEKSLPMAKVLIMGSRGEPAGGSGCSHCTRAGAV